MPRLSISICILFHEKVEQTIECIGSFLASGVPIYVLNNNSSEPAREKLGDFCNGLGQVRILDSDVNLGVGVGRNRLIKETADEWLLFVDNDISMKTREWVNAIRNHIHSYPEAEVFVPRLFNVHEKNYVKYHNISISKNRALFNHVTDAVSNSFPGGASFVNRRLFRRLGLYDEEMFVGLEDFELCLRGVMAEAPVRARIVEDIELIHDHRQATLKTDREAVLTRYNVHTIENSFERLTLKHGLKLEHKWKPWVADQVKMMLGGETLWKIVTGRLGKLLRRIIESREVAKSVPQSCTLFMTDKCNLRCAGCSRSMTGVKPCKEMKLDTVKKMLSLYPSIKSYCVAGLGEPTLCLDFVNVVDYLKEKGKYVGIITNGTNLNELLALRYGADYISISLYGYDEESYRSYCGENVFNKVISNFKELKERYKNVGFSYIINRQNYGEFGKVLLLCDHLRPDFLHLVNYLVYDVNNKDEINKIITIKDKDIIETLRRLSKGRQYVKLQPHFIDPDNPEYNCRSYERIINLDGEGNIGGCQRQKQPDVAYGNIFRDSDPYNCHEMMTLRRKLGTPCFLHDECKFCFGNWARS